MLWITALALSAINPQVSNRNEIYCDMAPYLGQGSSSDGPLNSMTGLSLGCAVVLLGNADWTLAPRLEFAEQHWSIYQNREASTLLDSFEARTLGLGLQAAYNPSQTWQLSYSLSYAQGRGSQEQNLSTASSSQNLRFSNMTQHSLRHDLSYERPLTPRLSWLLGVQFDDARQSWKASRGSLKQENVAPGNKLTLTNGSVFDLATPLHDQSSYRSYNLRVGLSLLIY